MGGNCGKTGRGGEKTHVASVVMTMPRLGSRFFVLLELWEFDPPVRLLSETVLCLVCQLSSHQSQRSQFRLSGGCYESCEVSEEEEGTQSHDIYQCA